MSQLESNMVLESKSTSANDITSAQNRFDSASVSLQGNDEKTDVNIPESLSSSEFMVTTQDKASTSSSNLLQSFLQKITSQSLDVPCGSSDFITCGPYFVDEFHTKQKNSSNNNIYHHTPITDMSMTSTSSSVFYDPHNRNIVGPPSCEYCGASVTISCSNNHEIVDSVTGKTLPKCTRPKYYFLKKRPPFDSNDSKWDPITEHVISDSSHIRANHNSLTSKTVAIKYFK